MITPQEINLSGKETNEVLIQEVKKYSRLLAADINKIEKRLTDIEERLTLGRL